MSRSKLVQAKWILTPSSWMKPVKMARESVHDISPAVASGDCDSKIFVGDDFKTQFQAKLLFSHMWFTNAAPLRVRFDWTEQYQFWQCRFACIKVMSSAIKICSGFIGPIFYFLASGTTLPAGRIHRWVTFVFWRQREIGLDTIWPYLKQHNVTSIYRSVTWLAEV